ncbi:cryptochrome/deoxyribodipyrimidine photo-lyase family protein [Rhodobaculum claviforme]|uniref:Deoxyribodipyrimidine photolyase n=1 Tax=Rhodobaculum claviforme TaxID=1549854 RepID=A0A934TLK9_9RHOB|nr:FAD-binding domain-containing protein [Rhodobaculum claviforme]MBK5927771.1 deoxyribodipyrimidine photolyase [Rhodobaculum claviforme]
MTGSIVWFKRDLRVADHAALCAAAALGPVLPLYVVEPELWAQPDASARQWAFVAECLEALRGDLAALGAPLVVRTGCAVEVLETLARRHRLSRIFSHEETGTLWTFARDRRVGAWARANGMAWHEGPQSGVVRRLAARDGWAGRRDRFLAAPAAQPPGLSAVPGVAPGPIPTARTLRLAEDRCPHRQVGGRQAALTTLGGFLTSRGEGYRAAMASPVAGERACSRLSPHLAFGVLSGREVAHAAAARRAERPGGGWGASLRSFESRLAWRDHFMQKLEDAPDLEARCLHRATESLRPRTPDATRLAAFQSAETGIPFVDACLRYLAATGWLNFRMRAMLVSVAANHLWLDWRATGPFLARRFTDYEPGIHWSQMQMQSGTTGINTIRIYNPVKQGRDQDPDGRFTRAWLPELAEVPDAFLHEPWRWGGAGRVLGRAYPEPVVDVAAAARAAREAVWGLRRARGFAAEAAEVARKHASRKDRSGHFVNDRAPRRRRPAAAPGQLSLDL